MRPLWGSAADGVFNWSSQHLYLEVFGGSLSAGSRSGDAYDNAAAETVMGMYENEAIAKNSPFNIGPLKTLADVEELTFDWFDWCNNRRLYSTLDYLPPAKYEANYCAETNGPLFDEAANKMAEYRDGSPWIKSH